MSNKKQKPKEQRCKHGFKPIDCLECGVDLRRQRIHKRKFGCLVLLLAFFVWSILTMHPANKRTMCATMGIGEYTPLVCQ